MFDAAPEAFHKDMVQCPASPVHADCDAVRLENINKHLTGELTALVRVEYLRHTVDLYLLFQAVHAESLTAYSTTAMPASNLHEYQSITATRYSKPRNSLTY